METEAKRESSGAFAADSQGAAFNFSELFGASPAGTALDSSQSLGRDRFSQRSDNGLGRLLGKLSISDGSAERSALPADSPQEQSAPQIAEKAVESSVSASIRDGLSDVVAKIGQFLESVLPPEYSQYVQQYLPMAEQYISNLIRDVKTGDGPNGSKHMEAQLDGAHSVPDLLPGTSLEVSPELGFDMSWSGGGAELSNIHGLRLAGQENGEIRSGRLDINGGSPELFATVQDAGGQTNEVPIPLPDVSTLLSQF